MKSKEDRELLREFNKCWDTALNYNVLRLEAENIKVIKKLLKLLGTHYATDTTHEEFFGAGRKIPVSTVWPHTVETLLEAAVKEIRTLRAQCTPNKGRRPRAKKR